MATEKRLIDANALLHDKVWLCGGFVGDPYCDGYMEALDKVETVIREFPSVDAVEVVRCKDCKYYGDSPYGNGDMMCDRWGEWIFPNDDDFCSYGERREEEWARLLSQFPMGINAKTAIS